MPRKDLIHEAVRNALLKDGWTITADPYLLEYGAEDLFVDLAAERLLAVEREGRRIAVEIKSFLGRSPVNDLQNALGQYAVYLSVIEIVDPQRRLFLAISKSAYDDLAELETFHLVVHRFQVALIVVRVPSEEIVEWIE
jgi:XisH protein